jgi:hypothetical protein
MTPGLPVRRCIIVRVIAGRGVPVAITIMAGAGADETARFFSPSKSHGSAKQRNEYVVRCSKYTHESG